MFENYPEPGTWVLISVSLFSFIGWIKAVYRNKELKDICDSLKKVNDNLSKKFPDIRTLISVSEKQKVSVTENDQGVKTYRAVRVKGAPDICLGDIAEVVIAANSKEKAVELLNETPYFEDDGWWTVEAVEKEEVITVKHLGGLPDD